MLRILIVDDEIETRNNMTSCVNWSENGLILEGCADDGISAYEMIEKKMPDIVLIDINMPGMSGLEVIEKCRSQIKHHSSFIIISGYDDFQYAQKAIGLGVEEYLLKPFQIKDLLNAIKKSVINIQAMKELSADKNIHNFFDIYRNLSHAETMSVNLNYPVEEEKVFIDCLKKGNCNEASDALENILNIIENDTFSFSSSVSYATIFYIEITRTLMERGLSSSRNVFYDFLWDNDHIIESLKAALRLTFQDAYNLMHQNKKISICVLQAMTYIKEHFAEELSLNQISDAVYVSPAYLSSLFKQSTGTHLSEFINEVRIEKSKKLMEDTQYKLYEISELVGYKDVKYFSNIFRKITGFPPSQFRNQMAIWSSNSSVHD